MEAQLHALHDARIDAEARAAAAESEAEELRDEVAGLQKVERMAIEGVRARSALLSTSK